MKDYSIIASQIIGCVILLASAALYAYTTYQSWDHIAGLNDAFRLSLFSFALSVLGYSIYSIAMCHWNRPLSMALLASAVVFLPAKLFNEPDQRILVIAVEGLRADKTSLYGGRLNSTPNLKEWIRSETNIVSFHDAVAHSNDTVSSLHSLLSGNPIDPDAKTLNVTLAEEGWETRLAYTASSPRAGMNVEYDEQLALYEAGAGGTDGMLTAFREWFEDAPSNSMTVLDYSAMQPIGSPEKRFDVFVADGADSRQELVQMRPEEAHKVDRTVRAHAPLHYAGSLLEMDSYLGSMLLEMEQAGELENTMVVFTAPHGWGLFDHGQYAANGQPFDEMCHVPLLVRFPSPVAFPSVRPRTKDVFAPVQLADVVPTLSGYLKQDWSESGRDLTAAVFRGQRPEDTPIPLRAERHSGTTVGVRFQRWKLFEEHKRNGDVATSVWEILPPHLDRPVIGEHAELEAQLQAHLDRFYGDNGEGRVAQSPSDH